MGIESQSESFSFMEFFKCVFAKDLPKEYEKMACLCRNPDGTFAQTCNGTCSTSRIKEIDAMNERATKSIEDRLEYLLSIFLKQLDHKIQELYALCEKKYREGYRDGFNDGQNGY